MNSALTKSLAFAVYCLWDVNFYIQSKEDNSSHPNQNILSPRSQLVRKSRGAKQQSAKCQMGNWHPKKYLDGQTKGKMKSHDILGLAKQLLMAFFLLYLIP